MTRSNSQSQNEAPAIERRLFLIGAAAAAASATAWGQKPDPAKLKRMSMMTGNFGSLLKRAGGPDDPNRTLDILDLPGMIAERFGVHNVEFQHTNFASTEPEFLAEVRNRFKKANSQMSQINLEFGDLNISAPTLVRRLETIDLTKQWIDHAVAVGCPRVMVNPGSIAPEFKPAAIETLKVITAYAKTKKIFITMENRGQSSSRSNPPGMVTPRAPRGGQPPSGPLKPVYMAPWEVIVEVAKAAGAYANPDWGHFPDDEARTEGLAVMYRMTAGSSHCRLTPERYDSAKCLKIARDAGYKGLFSIEGGGSADPYKSVQAIVDFMVANM